MRATSYLPVSLTSSQSCSFMPSKNAGRDLVSRNNVSSRLAVWLFIVFFAVAWSNASSALGAVTVTAIETGGDVVFTGSGTLNIDTGTLFGGVIGGGGGVSVDSGFQVGPPPNQLLDAYTFDNFSGPSFIGPGTESTIATSGLGDLFGVEFGGLLLVPDGYTSEDPLLGSSTYAGETFASLGLVPGTYMWTWGSDSNADSLVLNVVPEPSSLLLASLAGFICCTRWRR